MAASSQINIFACAYSSVNIESMNTSKHYVYGYVFTAVHLVLKNLSGKLSL